MSVKHLLICDFDGCQTGDDMMLRPGSDLPSNLPLHVCSEFVQQPVQRLRDVPPPPDAQMVRSRSTVGDEVSQFRFGRDPL